MGSEALAGAFVLRLSMGHGNVVCIPHRCALDACHVCYIASTGIRPGICSLCIQGRDCRRRCVCCSLRALSSAAALR
jgi:hypothetical protein